MAKDKKPRKQELLRDYRMLDRISETLLEHQKNIRAINKRIASKVKTDLRYGLIENLNVVADHMEKAQEELEKARKELELI